MKGIPKHSDRIYVKKLKQGSCAAFRQIFNRYQEKLLFYSITIVKSESAGKDIVQETFIRLWINRNKLDPDQALSGYLHTIARNLALNHLKRAAYDHDMKQQIRQKIDNTPKHNSIEDNLFARESSQLIQKAVARLPSQRRLIFQLSRQNGMTHKEIGLKLGISKNTVKNQMVSALKEVRAYLKHHTNISLTLSMIVIVLSG